MAYQNVNKNQYFAILALISQSNRIAGRMQNRASYRNNAVMCSTCDCNFVFVIKLSGNFSLASSLYLRFPLDWNCWSLGRIQVNLSEYDYNGNVDVKSRIMNWFQRSVKDFDKIQDKEGKKLFWKNFFLPGEGNKACRFVIEKLCNFWNWRWASCFSPRRHVMTSLESLLRSSKASHEI